MLGPKSARVFVASIVMASAAACSPEPAATQAGKSSPPEQQSLPEDQDPALRARGYQIGTASIVGAPAGLACQPDFMNASAPGCTPRDCRSAKRAAAARLRARVQPPACRDFVQESTRPCRSVNCP